MAGVKGRSGGVRHGAGRKPKQNGEEKQSGPFPIAECDMLKMLQDVALGRVEATALQVRAAIAAVQYTHVKAGEGGKKEESQEAARRAGTGKFSSAAPPMQLVRSPKPQGHA